MDPFRLGRECVRSLLRTHYTSDSLAGQLLHRIFLEPVMD